MIRLVYLFQTNLITFLKKECSTPDKIIYFSNGAASQYKNRKNLNNLCHHQADFGIKAEWHFSATTHGKSTHEGLGGLQTANNDSIPTLRVGQGECSRC